MKVEERTASDSQFGLPFAHLNLRFNPFGKLTRYSKNQISVLRLDIQPYVKRLRSPGYALQFLKEGARNKTTTMLAIHRAIPNSAYVRLREGVPIPKIPEAPVLCIDWMHLMPRENRRRILKRDAAFCIVSHLNHRREFKAAGLAYELVKLPIYTAEQLKKQVDRRIAWAQRDNTRPVPTVSFDTVARLLAKFGDDADVIYYLYDVFEKMEEIGDVQILD